MAQAAEVTEVSVNGIIHKTPIIKSYSTKYIKLVSTSGTGSEVELYGRTLRDVRVTAETRSAILALANAAVTTDITPLVSVTISDIVGRASIETPYGSAISKEAIVEFYEHPEDPTQTIVITSVDKGTVERTIYTVVESYATIKARYAV